MRNLLAPCYRGKRKTKCAQAFLALGAVVFRSEALGFGASVARSDQERGQSTTFTKLVLEGGGLGFYSFGGAVFFFNSFADLCFLPRLSKLCVSLRVGQARSSIGNAYMLRLDGGAGQEAPPDSFGLSFSVHGAPGGIIHLSSISHAFPTAPHSGSLCQNPVALCEHRVLVPGTLSLVLLRERGRVSPEQQGDRGHGQTMPPTLSQPAPGAPITLLGSLPPPQCSLV